MDESKKKLVLALVAVLALGAAGYTMFSGGSASNDKEVQKTSKSKRFVRAPRDKTTKKKVRKRRAVEPVKRTAKRAERVRTERKASTTKKRRGHGRKLEKKKKLVPAS